MTENISLLGSTGSIGTQSLDVCRMHGYKVKCLTANSRVDIIEQDKQTFRRIINELSAQDATSKEG